MAMRDEAARLGLCSPETFVELDAALCERPLHAAFERQASRRPDDTAVRSPEGDLTYAELDAVANRAACALLACGARAEQPVAVILGQGRASIVWTLAILKAGLSYAPLDQRLPATVLRAMVDHLEPGILIADTAGHATLAGGSLPVTVTDPLADADGAGRRWSSDEPGARVDPDAIACVFHTSGSTGSPKAVVDTHRNVLANIRRYANSLRFAPGDTLSLVQNPSFSGTMSSLFGALVTGAALAPFDLDGEGLRTLSTWLKASRVTVFHGVPAIFRRLSDAAGQFPDIRLVRLEGDRATGADVAHFNAHFRAGCTLVNGLGATECGLVRQFFVARGAEPAPTGTLPVGYAVPGAEVHVVDESGSPLPAGTLGEIEVEGAHLALGYWREPELTARRFVGTSSGSRRYRTGDLGWMDDDGCLTLVGRADRRLRIAGQFVDADAVERSLLALPGVAQCIVRDFDDAQGERRLCAYVVAAPEAALRADTLRRALTESLAPQLVPATFVFLQSLPLTKDMKVDPARLPAPGRARPALENDYVAPRTELEHRLAGVWSEVLGIEPVGVTDSFLDLGGDSLRAAEVANRLQAWPGGTVAVATLFEHPTIGALARALDGADAASPGREAGKPAGA
jgi:amino acid adenylation domain-containing protein